MEILPLNTPTQRFGKEHNETVDLLTETNARIGDGDLSKARVLVRRIGEIHRQVQRESEGKNYFEGENNNYSSTVDMLEDMRTFRDVNLMYVKALQSIVRALVISGDPDEALKIARGAVGELGHDALWYDADDVYESVVTAHVESGDSAGAHEIVTGAPEKMNRHLMYCHITVALAKVSDMKGVNENVGMIEDEELREDCLYRVAVVLGKAGNVAGLIDTLNQMGRGLWSSRALHDIPDEVVGQSVS